MLKLLAPRQSPSLTHPMANVPKTQDETDQLSPYGVPNEIIELIAGHADSHALKALRLVNSLVKKNIPKPFAIRLFGTLIIRTTTADMSKSLQLLGAIDFTNYAREVELLLYDFKDAAKVAELLQAVLSKLPILKTITLSLDGRPSRLTIEQAREFTDRILQTIQDADLPNLKELNITQTSFAPTQCTAWGVGAIEACITAHQRTLREFHFKDKMNDHDAWDRLLRTISKSGIEKLLLNDCTFGGHGYVASVTGYDPITGKTLRLVKHVRSPGSKRAQLYNIDKLTASMDGKAAVEAGIAVILGMRGKLVET